MTRIVRSSKTCGGQWRVAGTRLTVAHLLTALASQGSVEGVLSLYPHLKTDDVLACLSWAARKIESKGS